MFKVYKKRCDQCLFSRNKIVSNERRKSILDDCAKQGTFFTCHKATIAGQEICCRGFYDAQGSSLVQIAKRLQIVEEVDLPEEAEDQGTLKESCYAVSTESTKTEKGQEK